MSLKKPGELFLNTKEMTGKLPFLAKYQEMMGWLKTFAQDCKTDEQKLIAVTIKVKIQVPKQIKQKRQSHTTINIYI